MTLLSRAFKSLTITRAIDSSLWQGVKSRAGVSVTPSGAMGLVAVYSAVSLIAQSIAQLPVKFFVTDDETMVPQKPEQWRALWDRPNPYQSRSAFYETIVTSLLLWGNSYTALLYSERGDLIEAWPIDPARVIGVEAQENGAIAFNVTGHGWVANQRDDTQPAILFIPGLTMPGRLTGMSPIEQAMEQIGLGHAIVRSAAGFYGNGMRPAGTIEVAGKLNREQARMLSKRMHDANGGADKAGGWPVLDNGAKLSPLMISPQEAQFIEQQRYSDQKVASLFRVPPHLIGDVARSTSWGAGIEEQTIGFVTYTLGPWLKKIEEAVGAALLRDTPYEVEFMVQGLMRGSAAGRWKVYGMALDRAVMSPNEVRRKEGMPPYEGGDAYRAALNTAETDADDDEQPTETDAA